MAASGFLVASRLSDGNGRFEVTPIQPLQEVFGILPCGIDADVQMQTRMLACELVERSLELPITVGRFGEVERFRGGSFLFIEK